MGNLKAFAREVRRASFGLTSKKIGTTVYATNYKGAAERIFHGKTLVSDYQPALTLAQRQEAKHGRRWKRRNENWFGLNPKHKRSRGGVLHGAFTHKLTEQPLQK